jgi:hypothetical protein
VKADNRKHIHAHVGADLHIEGPEFGGNAHVDFYLFGKYFPQQSQVIAYNITGFTVYFGASPARPPPLKLENDGETNGFYQIVKLPGPGQPPPEGRDDTADPAMTNLHVTLEAGAYTEGSSKTASSNDASNPPTNPTTKWKVRAGSFRFRVTCDFAISSYSINNEPQTIAYDAAKAANKEPRPTEAPIYAFPMQVTTPVTSDLKIFVVNQEVANDGKIPTPKGVAPPLTTEEIKAIGNFDDEPYLPSFVVKSVPKALWTSYNPNLDPIATDGAGLLAGSTTTPTVDLAMGVTIGAPKPTLSQDSIPFAFNALDAMRANVFGGTPTNPDANDPNILPPLPAQSSWLPHPVDHPNDAAGWTEVQDLWKPSTELKGVLSECMSALGWDQPPPEVKAKLGSSGVVASTRMPWELNDEFPEVLEKGLGTYYLTLPQIAGVA